MQKIKNKKISYNKQRNQYDLWINLKLNIDRYINLLDKNSDEEKTEHLLVEIQKFLLGVKRKAKNIGYSKKNSIFMIIEQQISYLKKNNISDSKKSLKNFSYTINLKNQKIK